jgi:hypothetical protein
MLFTYMLALPLNSLVSDAVYRSVFVDQGQLHILLTSGEEILPDKSPGQLSFDSPKISPDAHTVGWLVVGPLPVPPGAGYEPPPIALELVIYRAGHVLNTFSTGQVFWDWNFRAGGKRVAYAAGPTHGGAKECVLRDVQSGRTVATWLVTPQSRPPVWAQDLRR